MPLFGWDEISNELIEIVEPLDLGWTNPKTYANGVKLLLSDRNHVALEVEAATRDEADRMFEAVDPTYIEWRRSCVGKV